MAGAEGLEPSARGFGALVEYNSNNNNVHYSLVFLDNQQFIIAELQLLLVFISKRKDQIKSKSFFLFWYVFNW